MAEEYNGIVIEKVDVGVEIRFYDKDSSGMARVAFSHCVNNAKAGTLECAEWFDSPRTTSQLLKIAGDRL